MKGAELRKSMSRHGNCWDNAPQESFFGHMKDESAGAYKFRTPKAAKSNYLIEKIKRYKIIRQRYK